MAEHPIEGLMVTAMNSIKDMIDVNTIIGEPIETSNNTVIIPISKVSFGFAAGGSEFKGETINEYSKKEKEEAIQYRLPFGGGAGVGSTISPIAFLIIQPDNVKLIPINHSSSIDKLLDYVPDFLEKISTVISSSKEKDKSGNEDTNKIIEEMRNKTDETIRKARENKIEIENKIEQEIEKIRRPDNIDYDYDIEYNEKNEDE